MLSSKAHNYCIISTKTRVKHDLHQTIIQGDNQSCQYFAWHKNTEVQVRIARRIQYLQHSFCLFKKSQKSKVSVSLKEWQDEQNPNNKNDSINVPPPPSVQTQSERFLTINPGTVRGLWVPFLNGGLWERDSQVLVASHVVIVKVNQGLDGLLHCWHLDQSHFTILEKLESFHSASGIGEE